MIFIICHPEFISGSSKDSEASLSADRQVRNDFISKNLQGFLIIIKILQVKYNLKLSEVLRKCSKDILVILVVIIHNLLEKLWVTHY